MSTKDSTAQHAQSNAGHVTPQEKIEGLLEIQKEIGHCMLTTRAPSGSLASRAMHPATTSGLVYSFYINTESGKLDDVETDPNVNVSYLSPKTTDWVSVSGKAKINTDKEKVKKHWSKSIKAWFDDRKDGVHTGDENDPRVGFLEVEPTEIRYFKADGKLSQAFQAAKAAVSANTAAPGKLIIITHEEIQLATKVAASG